MSVYDNLIGILFKLPDGRSLEEYFKNILLVGKISSSDLKSGGDFPSDGVKKYGSYDEILADFSATSQVAKEAYAAFAQKNNTQTPSAINYLIVCSQDTDESLTEALNRAKSTDGKFVKVVPISRLADDIKEVASWCLINDRFCDFIITSPDLSLIHI